MKVLIADDEVVSRKLLERALLDLGYEVLAVCDGAQAWVALQADNSPRLAVLDWMMPELDGLQLCKRLRAEGTTRRQYIIMLTSRGETADIVAGLEAGADDYITKPFHFEELRARLSVGVRILTLECSLEDRIRALQDALDNVKTLQALLPICSYCRRIRDDRNYWAGVEEYISSHSDSRFTHSICPDCYRTIVEPQIKDFSSGE